MALYQIIDGAVLPVTYAYQADTRTYLLGLHDPITGYAKTVTISACDLAENLGTLNIEIGVYNKCFWTPQITINDGADEAKSPKLKVQVTYEPEAGAPVNLPPIAHAFISTDLEALEKLRDQHVVIPMDPTGWYMDFPDIDLVKPGDPGPKLKNIDLPITSPVYPEYLKYISQPQAATDFWMKSHGDPNAPDYYPTVVRIDTKPGDFYPVNWLMTTREYSLAVGSDFGLWCYIVDILGNCSVFTFDAISMAPPFSAYYPAEDLPLYRRNHRLRGPRESHKQTGAFYEVQDSLGRILGNAQAQFVEIYDEMATRMDSKLYKIVREIRHTRSQRGVR